MNQSNYLYSSFEVVSLACFFYDSRIPSPFKQWGLVPSGSTGLKTFLPESLSLTSAQGSSFDEVFFNA